MTYHDTQVKYQKLSDALQEVTDEITKGRHAVGADKELCECARTLLKLMQSTIDEENAALDEIIEVAKL